MLDSDFVRTQISVQKSNKMFSKFVPSTTYPDKDPTIRHKHVAIVFKKHKPVCTGVNRRNTHTKMLQYGYNTEYGTIHAELDAVIKMGNVDYSNYTILVMRIRSSGLLGMAKPCKLCEKMLFSVGFKHVWYSTNEGVFEQLW